MELRVPYTYRLGMYQNPANMGLKTCLRWSILLRYTLLPPSVRLLQSNCQLSQAYWEKSSQFSRNFKGTGTKGYPVDRRGKHLKFLISLWLLFSYEIFLESWRTIYDVQSSLYVPQLFFARLQRTASLGSQLSMLQAWGMSHVLAGVVNVSVSCPLSCLSTAHWSRRGGQQSALRYLHTWVSVRWSFNHLLVCYKDIGGDRRPTANRARSRDQSGHTWLK